jgi:hypothetical protein
LQTDELIDLKPLEPYFSELVTDLEVFSSDPIL